jgi:P pilus assembly chaperone PapD
MRKREKLFHREKSIKNSYQEKSWKTKNYEKKLIEENEKVINNFPIFFSLIKWKSNDERKVFINF